ncbi:uncharacterized protein LOC141719310 [Apium graveolens]|uniref:uncharacterized protein LOC141719310 n=1 Tax=Apium graveolens TaxID=4045 RepID=UPI003D796024
MTAIRRDRTPPQRERTPPREPPPYHKVISFIAGGSEVCGETYSQAKCAVRETGVRVANADVKEYNIPALVFDEKDRGHVKVPQQDSLIISLPIGNCLIKRILVDNGSAANIMILSTLNQMGLAESDMIMKTTTLVGFSGETKRTMGEISLSMYAQGVNLLQRFLIIDGIDSTYIIMGRPWIHNLKAVPSTYHQVMKFPIPWGVQQIVRDQNTAMECYKTFLKPTISHDTKTMHGMSILGPEKLAEVNLSTGEKKMLVGEDLSPNIEANLVQFMSTNLDAFA